MICCFICSVVMICLVLNYLYFVDYLKVVTVVLNVGFYFYKVVSTIFFYKDECCEKAKYFGSARAWNLGYDFALIYYPCNLWRPRRRQTLLWLYFHRKRLWCFVFLELILLVVRWHLFLLRFAWEAFSIWVDYGCTI